MNNQNCPTNLLSDLPEDKDLFEGAHERVAEALVTVINKEEVGSRLGLKVHGGRENQLL